MKPIVNIQIDGLLSFLRAALRSDPVLIEHMQCSPDEIVRGIYRIQPVWEDGGVLHVDATQLPCLACYTQSDRNAWVESIDGHISTCQLWYVFELPVDDIHPETGRPMPSAERAENWKEAVWHRVCYWLRMGVLPDAADETFNGLTETFNLYEHASISEIPTDKSAEFFPPGRIGGWRASIEVHRSGPPFDVPDPLLLKLINLTLPVGDVDTPTGPTVGAAIDVSS